MDGFFAGIDFAMREATLFAACGFLLLGASDLAVDLIWIWRTAWRRITIYRRFARAQADKLASRSGRGASRCSFPPGRKLP